MAADEEAIENIASGKAVETDATSHAGQQHHELTEDEYGIVDATVVHHLTCRHLFHEPRPIEVRAQHASCKDYQVDRWDLVFVQALQAMHRKMRAEGVRHEDKARVRMPADQVPQSGAEEQHCQPSEERERKGQRAEITVTERLDGHVRCPLVNQIAQTILPLAERANAMHRDHDALWPFG